MLQYYLIISKGTPITMAPEIYKGVYNEKVDIWSLGIIIYKLVFGCYPFNTKTKE